MAKLIFKGWREGNRKISFTTLINKEAGLGLKPAKNILDKIGDGETVEILIDDLHTARTVASKAEEFGIITELIE